MREGRKDLKEAKQEIPQRRSEGGHSEGRERVKEGQEGREGEKHKRERREGIEEEERRRR